MGNYEVDVDGLESLIGNVDSDINKTNNQKKRDKKEEIEDKNSVKI